MSEPRVLWGPGGYLEAACALWDMIEADQDRRMCYTLHHNLGSGWSVVFTPPA
jgi:hypothetical protein